MEQEIKKFIGNVDEVITLFKQKVKRIEDERDALQARCDRYEKALKEIVKNGENVRSTYTTGHKPFYLKIANEALNGEGEKDGILKVGLKFRSKVAPLCSYEVVKIFPETKEFKVKETRECQVSGTTCNEVWSIDGFEKYYNLGVYYIQKGDKQ